MPSSAPWRMPSLWRRSDEEMAKKDDDLPLANSARQHARRPSHWQATRIPRRRWVLRLVAYALFIAFLLFFLFQRFSDSHSLDGSSDVDNNAGAPHRHHDLPDHYPSFNAEHHSEPEPGPAWKETKKKPAKKKPIAVVDSHPNTGPAPPSTSPPPPFDGPIHFRNLAATLRRISSTGGSSFTNYNVLFAAASLRSAATLLPMACQMSQQRQSYVHFAFVGRSEIPLEELLEINGIDKSCSLIVHDARPDYSSSSTELRMTLAAARALYHINTYMHPQAILIDSTNAEEQYFIRGIRDQTSATQASLIELPQNAGKRLSWIVHLDASSLAAWNQVRFDIVIHAPRTGSGNLKRLLRSIARADLGGLSVPHITVELPSSVEPPLQDFLASYRWPPSSPADHPSPQMFSLRHRIPSQRLSQEESSVRFLESFWPTDPARSHVLVLSPHTEISPQFFHYVKYSLLFQRHSQLAAAEAYAPRVMAISLALPSTKLDGTQALSPPRQPLPSESGRKGESTLQETAFAWQAPASDAVVFLGDKWAELHGYVSQVLQRQADTGTTPALLAEKEVSKKRPAWLEHALQLSRLRGYFTMYPSRATADALVSVHDDLPDVPEEYQDDVAAGEPEMHKLGDQGSGSQMDVLETLPNRGLLLLPSELPLLAWDGREKDMEGLEREGEDYLAKFRREVGGCGDEEEDEKLPLAEKDTTNLFCVYSHDEQT